MKEGTAVRWPISRPHNSKEPRIRILREISGLAIYRFPGSVLIFSCSRIARPMLEISKSFTDT
jgi:hypothetical protein